MSDISWVAETPSTKRIRSFDFKEARPLLFRRLSANLKVVLLSVFSFYARFTVGISGLDDNIWVKFLALIGWTRLCYLRKNWVWLIEVLRGPPSTYLSPYFNETPRSGTTSVAWIDYLSAIVLWLSLVFKDLYLLSTDNSFVNLVSFSLKSLITLSKINSCGSQFLVSGTCTL